MSGKLTPNTFPLEPVNMLASVVMMLSISQLCLVSHLEGNYMRLKAQEKTNKLTLSWAYFSECPFKFIICSKKIYIVSPAGVQNLILQLIFRFYFWLFKPSFVWLLHIFVNICDHMWLILLCFWFDILKMIHVIFNVATCLMVE